MVKELLVISEEPVKMVDGEFWGPSQSAGVRGRSDQKKQQIDQSAATLAV